MGVQVRWNKNINFSMDIKSLIISYEQSFQTWRTISVVEKVELVGESHTMVRGCSCDMFCILMSKQMTSATTQMTARFLHWLTEQVSELFPLHTVSLQKSYRLLPLSDDLQCLDGAEFIQSTVAGWTFANTDENVRTLNLSKLGHTTYRDERLSLSKLGSFNT